MFKTLMQKPNNFITITFCTLWPTSQAYKWTVHMLMDSPHVHGVEF